MAAVRLDPGEPSSLARHHEWFRQVHAIEFEAVRHYDPARTRALFGRLAANGTRVTPTLSAHHAPGRPDELPARQEESKHLPPWRVAEWPTMWEELTGGRTPRGAAMIRRIYAHRLRRRIDSVVVAGRCIGAGERARLLSDVARAAAGSGPPAAPAARRHCC